MWMIGSSAAWRCTSVSIASGSASVKKPPPYRRQLRRIAQHQHGTPKESRSRPNSASTIEHSSMTMRLASRRRLVLEHEAGGSSLCRGRGRSGSGSSRPVAALAAHDQRGLAGEGAERDLAVDALGEVAGERGLAGAGIAEQAEDLPRSAAARPRLEPGRDRVERGILMRSEDRHGALTVQCGGKTWPSRPSGSSSARRTASSGSAP